MSKRSKTHMIRGWVYILTNKWMPGIVKIGHSTRDPKIRAKELGGTSVPAPFDVAFDALVRDPHCIEMLVHEKLDAFRVSPEREFFACFPKLAVDEIVNILRVNQVAIELLNDPEYLYDKELAKKVPTQPTDLELSILADDAKEVGRLLSLGGRDPDEMTTKGFANVDLAAGRGSIEVVRALVEYGASLAPNEAIDVGCGPLCIACVQGHLDVARYLVENGAFVEVCSNNGASIIVHTCNQSVDNPEIIQFLIDECLDVNLPTCRGVTPLLLCASYGHVDSAEVLIRNGANVHYVKPLNSHEWDGKDALDLAMENNHAEIVQMLLEAGCNASKVQSNGKPLLANAVEDRHIGLAAIISEKGGNVFSKYYEHGMQRDVLMDVLICKQKELLEMLLPSVGLAKATGVDRQIREAIEFQLRQKSLPSDAAEYLRRYLSDLEGSVGSGDH